MYEQLELIKLMKEALSQLQTVREVKSIELNYQTHHVGRVGYGESIVKPYLKIEFK